MLTKLIIGFVVLAAALAFTSLFLDKNDSAVALTLTAEKMPQNTLFDLDVSNQLNSDKASQVESIALEDHQPKSTPYSSEKETSAEKYVLTEQKSLFSTDSELF